MNLYRMAERKPIPILLKSTSPEGEVRFLKPLRRHQKDLDLANME